MYETNEFMSSSERLVAFLDGELSQEQTSTLFYELANNSELQDEMRQFVQLRNSLKNSQITPPPALRNSILKNIGLKEGPLGTLADIGSKSAVLFSLPLFNKISLSILVISLLSITAYYALDNKSNQVLTDEVRNISILKSHNAPNNPVMESYSSEKIQSHTDGGNTKIIKKSSNSTLGLYASDNKKSNVLYEDELEQANTINAASSDKFYAVIHLGSFAPYSSLPLALLQNSFMPDIKIQSESFLGNIMENTSLYFRKFGAVSFPGFDLANENNPLMNDISGGFRYRIDENNSIGLAVGIENFRMSYNKDADGIIYQYNQIWNGSWLAVTYHYNFHEIGSTGLYPELNLLAGSTVIGPILKGGLGANYYVSDNFYLNFGLEYGMLIYSESQSNGSKNYYSTEKLGGTVGLGFGF
ncbi:MAG: hypothetical protein WCZ17_11665 [Candidatus Kapaibacterium sp.]